MLTPEEIKEINKKIAYFMGYIYFEPNVDIDYSDIGGMYEKYDVYSKVPIEVDDYPEDNQKYFKELPNPDFGKEKPIKWISDLKTIGWDSLNLGNYKTELKYNSDWNELMEVIEKIESIGDDFDTEKNYHIYIGKRYTRVIYDWNGFHQYPDKEDFERLEKSSKDYRHIVFDNDKRLSTFISVSDFIDWYNEQNNNDRTRNK